MKTDSMNIGSGAPAKTNPPASYLYITSGVGPYTGFYYTIQVNLSNTRTSHALSPFPSKFISSVGSRTVYLRYYSSLPTIVHFLQNVNKLFYLQYHSIFRLPHFILIYFSQSLQYGFIWNLYINNYKPDASLCPPVLD